MDDVELTNYEQEDPDHPTEEEALDRANRRLDEKLRQIDESKERIEGNAGRRSDSRS